MKMRVKKAIMVIPAGGFLSEPPKGADSFAEDRYLVRRDMVVDLTEAMIESIGPGLIPFETRAQTAERVETERLKRRLPIPGTKGKVTAVNFASDELKEAAKAEARKLKKAGKWTAPIDDDEPEMEPEEKPAEEPKDEAPVGKPEPGAEPVVDISKLKYQDLKKLAKSFGLECENTIKKPDLLALVEKHLEKA